MSICTNYRETGPPDDRLSGSLKETFVQLTSSTNAMLNMRQPWP